MGLIQKEQQLRETLRWRRSFLEIPDDASDSVQCDWIISICSTTVISSTAHQAQIISTTDDGGGVQTTNPPTTFFNPPKPSADSAGEATTNTITSAHTVDGVPVTSTYFQTVTATANADTSNPPSSSSSDIALPIGTTVGAVFFVALLIALFFIRLKRKQKRSQAVGLLSGEAQAAPPPGSPILKEGFFTSLRNRFSVGIGSPPPPACVENDKGPASPGMVELLGDVEHTSELPSGDGGMMTAPTELPNDERNNVGLGVGLRGGEREVQELGSHEAPRAATEQK
jgi:hypothetical protein